MNLEAIVVANSFGIALMAMLLVCTGHEIQHSSFSEKVFYAMIWTTMALCATEMASFLIDGKMFFGARVLAYVLNTLLFATNITFAYFWTLYVDYRLNGSMEEIRKKHRLDRLPVAGIYVILIVNLFHPILFSISPENVYARTPLTVISYLVTFLYLAESEWKIYTGKNNAKQYLFQPSVLFIVPLLIGSILQMMFYGLSLIWPSLSISVVSVYINLQSGYSSVDPLSGVYTRQYFDSWLQTRTQKQLSGIMIDLDRFKDINDTCGHLAGDQAIRDFGRLMRLTADSHDTVVRYGGDEFIMAREGSQEPEMRKFVSRLEETLTEFNRTSNQPYHLSFSVGYGTYTPGENDVNGFLKQMDQSMYLCKQEKSNILPERRGHVLSDDGSHEQEVHH